VKIVAIWSLIASGMVTEEEELMFALPVPVRDVMCLWLISFL